MSPDHLRVPTVNPGAFLIVLDETKDDKNYAYMIGNNPSLQLNIAPTCTDPIPPPTDSQRR